MNPESQFQFFEHYAIFRPSGEVTFNEAIDIVAEGLSFASSRQVDHLVVDTTGLTGFASPTIWERFAMSAKWASAAPGLRVALVARPELIDPARFGVTVARNRGLFTDVFSSEAEAIEWLLAASPQ
jgi:hypothetical protein